MASASDVDEPDVFFQSLPSNNNSDSFANIDRDASRASVSICPTLGNSSLSLLCGSPVDSPQKKLQAGQPVAKEKKNGGKKEDDYFLRNSFNSEDDEEPTARRGKRYRMKAMKASYLAAPKAFKPRSKVKRKTTLVAVVKEMDAEHKKSKKSIERLLIGEVSGGIVRSQSSGGWHSQKSTRKIVEQPNNNRNSRVVLEKLPDRGKTGRLKDEGESSATILHRNAGRQKATLPNKGWVVLKELIRPTSTELPSTSGFGEIDSVDCSESAGVPSTNYLAKAIFSLIDENCGDALLTELMKIPLDVVIQMTHPISRRNILQHALEASKFEIALSLVKLGGSDLVLRTDFDEITCIETCLHKVVKLGSLPLVQAVLDAFDATARADYLTENTALVLNPRSLSPDDTSSELVDLESKRTGSFPLVPKLQEQTKGSVLHLAASLGHLDIVKYLVKDANVKVNVPSNRDATPICLAIAHSHLPVVEFLHSAGAELSIKDSTGRSFINYAIMSGSEETVNIALRLLNEPSSCPHLASPGSCRVLPVSKNPLVMAAWHGSSAVVRALLQDTKIRSMCNYSDPTLDDGNTALHWACSRRSREATSIVSQLLEYTDEIHLPNREGKTPLMLTAEVGAVDAMMLLSKRMYLPMTYYFDVHDSSGRSVWEYAIDSKSNASLIALLEVACSCCETDARENPSEEKDSYDTKWLRKRPSIIAHLFVREAAEHEKAGVSRRLRQPEPLLGTASCASVDVEAGEGLSEVAAGRTGHGVKGLHSCVRMPAKLGGTTPLHLAAAKGDVAKLRVMLKYIFPWEKTVDTKGDTFLHTAAREGQLKVLEVFASRPAYVNQQNDNGDSVIAVACSAGQFACASYLLPMADMSLKNKQGRTAMHELCTLPDLPYELLRDFVDASRDLLLYKDELGRTALHHLAVHQNINREMVFKLFPKSDKICNAKRVDGFTPLHDALHRRCVENAFALLTTFGPSLDVNAQDDRGCVPMHIAIRECLVEAVLPLIQAGGNLLSLDKEYNTPLHTLVSCASEQPKQLNEYIKLLNEVLDCSVIWYCKLKKIVPIPRKCSEIRSEAEYYKQCRKCTIKLLLTAAYNVQGMNVIMWATYKCGGKCAQLLASLLAVPDVFCLQPEDLECRDDDDVVYYDVTDIVPDTCSPLRQAALLDCGMTPNELWIVPTHYKDRLVTTTTKKEYSPSASDAEWMAFYNAKSAYVEITKTKFRKISAKRSLVELIVDTRDHFSEQRWQLLDITPISEITKDYWEPYKYIYAVLMVAHVVYMAVFSEFSLQMTMVLDLSCAYGANKTSSITSSISIRRPPSTTGSSGFLLIWPCLIIISDVTYCASYLERRLQSLSALKSLGRASTSRNLCSQLIQQFRHLEVIDVATYWLVGVAFSWMAVVWFILHSIGDCHQDYVLAVVMISGWLYTINFTQGIQGVHHFSLVLQQIVLKDFLKFAFVFVSLLVGYSYAFQVLTLAIPSLRSQSIGSTFFKVFNWLIGMDDFYKVQHEEFERHGKESVVLLAMFVSYILLLNILLVNLLVAIMNDSYSSIYRRHRLMWRINSLRHALNIENHFPFVGNMLRKLLNKEIVRNSSSQHERFYLKVAKRRDDSSSDGDSEQCSLAAISSRLDSLAVTSDRLEQTMVELKERLELLTVSERKQLPSAVMSNKKASVSAAEHEAA